MVGGRVKSYLSLDVRLTLRRRISSDNAHRALLLTLRTDHFDWSLPAHRRRTLSGMDAAPEPTRTYLRRVPRWWAGGPCSQSPDQPLFNQRIPIVQSSFKTIEISRFSGFCQPLLIASAELRRRAAGMACEVAAEVCSVEKS
ncbi:hypothetical protein XarjCFBP7645_19655 [Xanthomonas arboricola]|uniref:Uncharacterized protein n=1 Tax=Xanthomonas arboricola TaxID=56448 RepID=A0A2S7ABZ6_9XANT|nr:hypothetical protein XarjCFBP7645_19655 [Xanthomonas arboricola]